LKTKEIFQRKMKLQGVKIGDKDLIFSLLLVGEKEEVLSLGEQTFFE
jgi:hypothetical protein